MNQSGQEAECRGCWSLCTACQKCKKCQETKDAFAVSCLRDGYSCGVTYMGRGLWKSVINNNTKWKDPIDAIIADYCTWFKANK